VQQVRNELRLVEFDDFVIPDIPDRTQEGSAGGGGSKEWLECIIVRRSECSVQVEWSPCGRYFLTASVAPRMRVDNRITIYTYYGKQIHEINYDELLAARWTPLAKVSFLQGPMHLAGSSARAVTDCASFCGFHVLIDCGSLFMRIVTVSKTVICHSIMHDCFTLPCPSREKPKSKLRKPSLTGASRQSGSSMRPLRRRRAWM
jgi:uncharacterized protein with WD repeat